MQLTLKATSSSRWSDGRLTLAAVVEDSDKETIVGCIDLYDYDPLNNRASVGIVVAPEWRQRGYALSMLAELRRFCTHTISLHQLYADILLTNTISQHLFERAGYCQCALMRDWILQDDHYVDAYRYQLVLQ